MSKGHSLRNCIIRSKKASVPKIESHPSDRKKPLLGARSETSLSPIPPPSSGYTLLPTHEGGRRLNGTQEDWGEENALCRTRHSAFSSGGGIRIPPETNGLLRREDVLERLEGFRDERDHSHFTGDGSCPLGAAYGFLMIRLAVPRGQLLELATGKKRRTAWC